MPTLLIADDHPLFREALRGAIKRLLPTATLHEAEDTDGLYAMVEAEPDADLLLLDLNIPGANGFSALVYLRAHFPELPVVVVSAREEPSVMRRALTRLTKLAKMMLPRRRTAGIWLSAPAILDPITMSAPCPIAA